ncbi:MAG TPA: hypothetical protein VEH29_11950 [Acidimicrobiales bacterium]|nr:hypothetical protein [Acidimicrobiales bacterium]
MRQIRRVSVVGALAGVLCWTAVTTVPALATGRSFGTNQMISMLNAVACASASSCEAVGQYSTKVETSNNLAEHWNGSKWTVQTVPRPKKAPLSELSGIACPSTKSCFAVGTYNLTLSLTAPFAEHWNGSKWELLPFVEPFGYDGGLNAVACPSVESCMAVGSFETTDGNLQNLAEYWNGSKWSAQRTIDVSGSDSELLGVACTSAASCTAVGHDGEVQVTFAEHWNGTDWTVQSTPNPVGMSTPSLDAVACHSHAMCMAVGTSNYGVTMSTLGERWDGSQWAIVTTENPSTAKYPDNNLAAVSCPNISRCIAVGYDSDTANAFLTLAESWNGSKWTTMAIPGSPVGPENQLTAVSCSSSSSCMAVGYSENLSYAQPTTIAERWNGSKWTVVSTPVP